MSLAGLAVGLAVGLGLAALLEITNVRVWKESDLEGLVPARVLVGIPRLSTYEEDRQRMLHQLMEIGAVAVVFILMLTGNLYAFFKG